MNLWHYILFNFYFFFGIFLEYFFIFSLIFEFTQRVDFIQVCNLAFVTPRFEMVEKTEIKELDEDARKTRIKSELALGNQIASLVGSAQLSNFLKYENDEIADFRRSATRFLQFLFLYFPSCFSLLLASLSFAISCISSPFFLSFSFFPSSFFPLSSSSFL